MTSRLRLRCGWVATMDPGRGDLRDVDVVVENGRIAGIGRQIEAGDIETVDLSHALLLPGLVDAHRHTWETLLRGVGVDWLQGHYFAGIHRSARQYISAEAVYVSTLLGALEALEAGVTGLVDWSHIMESPEHADAAVAALRDSGIRAWFAFGGSSRQWHGLPSSSPLDRAEVSRVRSRHFAARDGLVRMMLAARGPEFSTMDVVRADWQLADEFDLPISVHAGAGLKARTFPAIPALADAGLLREGTTYIHANHVGTEELRRVRDSGGHVCLAPEVELMMGMGALPTPRLLNLGIMPALSTDEVASGSGSMLLAMRTLLTDERGRAASAALADGGTPSRVTLTAREALTFATVGGAASVGSAGHLGVIAVGACADLIAVDLRASHLWPVNDPVNQFVMAVQPCDIELVMVGGQVVKRDGRLLYARKTRLLEQASSHRDRIFGLLGHEAGRPWLPRDLDGPAWFTSADTR